jgi:hypothetical protein
MLVHISAAIISFILGLIAGVLLGFGMSDESWDK